LLSVTLLIIYGVGIPFGIIGGKNPNSIRDRVIMLFTQISSSLPAFTMGYILILTFALSFRWFPFTGSVSVQLVSNYAGTLRYHLNRMHHVILPALSLALVQLIVPAKFLRGGIVDTMRLPFITTARAKGVKRKAIFRKHALSNAIPPIIATFPMQIVTLLSGMIIVEIVFGFPGVGQLLWVGDSNLLMILALMLAFTVLFLNVIADLILLKLDPRVEFEKN
jgi:peptide/nickel transport system permease protein